MSLRLVLLSIVFLFLSLSPRKLLADTITFNAVIAGQTSVGFDGDDDGVMDVVFSTTDPSGFDTTGPGLNQNYIQEPGLAGNAFTNPALRVTFLYGAIGSIQFGFALDSSIADPSFFANLRLYNADNALLGDVSVPGSFTATSLGQSSYPEGIVTLNFSGVASYGLFTFTSQSNGYVIDNFQGTFGNTEVPEPRDIVLLSVGLASLLSMGQIVNHRKHKGELTENAF